MLKIEMESEPSPGLSPDRRVWWYSIVDEAGEVLAKGRRLGRGNCWEAANERREEIEKGREK